MKQIGMIGFNRQSFLSLFSLGVTALLGAVSFLWPAGSGPIISFSQEWWFALFSLLAGVYFLQPSLWASFRFPLIALLPIMMAVYWGLHAMAGYFVYPSVLVVMLGYLAVITLLILLGDAFRHRYGLVFLAEGIAWVLWIVAAMHAVMLLMHPLQTMQAVQGAASLDVLVTAMGFVCLQYLYFKSRLPLTLLLLLGPLLLLALALTGGVSATPYVLLIAFCSIWLQRKRRQLGYAIWTVGVYAVWLGLLHYVPWSTERPPVDMAFPWRGYGALWLEAWEIFLKHPLLGAGWGQFAWQDFHLAHAFPEHTGPVTHPHNLLLQMLAETGAIGASLMTILTVLWCVRVWRLRGQQDREFLIMLVAILGGCILFQGGITDLRVIGLLALLMGILEPRVWQASLVLGRPIATMALCLGGLLLYKLHHEYQVIRFWHDQHAYERANEVQAARMLPMLGELRHGALLTPWIDLGIVRALPNHAAVLQDKLAINTDVVRFSPSAVDTYNQAELLALVGDPKQAKSMLARALIRHPDALYPFSVRLVKHQQKAHLPLLMMIVRHNRAYMKAHGIPIPKNIGKNSQQNAG